MRKDITPEELEILSWVQAFVKQLSQATREDDPDEYFNWDIFARDHGFLPGGPRMASPGASGRVKVFGVRGRWPTALGLRGAFYTLYRLEDVHVLTVMPTSRSPRPLYGIFESSYFRQRDTGRDTVPSPNPPRRRVRKPTQYEINVVRQLQTYVKDRAQAPFGLWFAETMDDLGFMVTQIGPGGDLDATIQHVFPDRGALFSKIARVEGRRDQARRIYYILFRMYGGPWSHVLLASYRRDASLNYMTGDDGVWVRGRRVGED